MSKSNALEADVVKYVSLHTGDPGEAGDQTTNEATYAGYARVAVARDSGGWTVTGSQALLSLDPDLFLALAA